MLKIQVHTFIQKMQKLQVVYVFRCHFLAITSAFALYFLMSVNTIPNWNFKANPTSYFTQFPGALHDIIE